MNEFSDECLLTFLQNQGQLFAEPVAETVEEAEAFLEDCMAVVVESIEEVRAIHLPPPFRAVLRLRPAFRLRRLLLPCPRHLPLRPFLR